MFGYINSYVYILNLYVFYFRTGLVSSYNTVYDESVTLILSKDIYNVVTTLLHNLL